MSGDALKSFFQDDLLRSGFWSILIIFSVPCCYWVFHSKQMAEKQSEPDKQELYRKRRHEFLAKPDLLDELAQWKSERYSTFVYRNL